MKIVTVASSATLLLVGDPMRKRRTKWPPGLLREIRRQAQPRPTPHRRRVWRRGRVEAAHPPLADGTTMVIRVATRCPRAIAP